MPALIEKVFEDVQREGELAGYAHGATLANEGVSLDSLSREAQRRYAYTDAGFSADAGRLVRQSWKRGFVAGAMRGRAAQQRYRGREATPILVRHRFFDYAIGPIRQTGAVPVVWEDAHGESSFLATSLEDALLFIINRPQRRG
jgi:hypothetical protein